MTSVDRRTTPRLVPARFGARTEVRLRPGGLVPILDVSSGGTAVSLSMPLRVGARLTLHTLDPHHSVALPVVVRRCVVRSLSNGVSYRVCLMFERPSRALSELATRVGYSVPGSIADPSHEMGTGYPSDTVSNPATARRGQK